MLERGRPIFPSRSRSLFFPLPCPICLVFCSTRIFLSTAVLSSLSPFLLFLPPSSPLSFFPILPFLSPYLYLLCPRIHFFARLSIRHSPEARFLFVLPSSAVSPNPFLLHSLSDRVSFFPSHPIPPSRPLFPPTSPMIPPRFSLDLYVSFLLYSRPSIRSFASFSSSLFRTLVPLPFYLRFTLPLYRLFHPLLRCPGPLFPLSRYNTAVFGAAWPHVSRDFECIGLDTPQLGAPFRTNFLVNADFSLGYIPARWDWKFFAEKQTEKRDEVSSWIESNNSVPGSNLFLAFSPRRKISPAGSSRMKRFLFKSLEMEQKRTTRIRVRIAQILGARVCNLQNSLSKLLDHSISPFYL